MAILKTTAVVLKTWKFGETSKIVSLLTKDFGKVRVMAKGARSPKSGFKGCLEPLTYIGIVFYDKKTRDLQLLSKTDLIDAHIRFIGDMPRTTLGFAAAELVDKAIAGNEPMASIFDLFVDVLSALNRSSGFLEGIFWFFESRLITLMGYKPTWDACISCGKSLGKHGGYFQPDSGGLLCTDCGAGGGGLKIAPESLEVLYWLQRGANSIDDIPKLSPASINRSEIRKMFDLYFKTHMDLKRGLRSLDFFYELGE